MADKRINVVVQTDWEMSAMLVSFMRQQFILQPIGLGAFGVSANEFSQSTVSEEHVIDHLVGRTAIDGAFGASRLPGVSLQLVEHVTT